MNIFSKTVLLFAFFSTAAFAQAPAPSAGPTVLTFPGTMFKVSVGWLQGPQVGKVLSSGAPDPTSESILAMQWIAGGDPGDFQVNVNMNMDGQTMSEPAPTMTPDIHPGRYRSSGLFFEMSGTWQICVTLHPKASDHVTSQPCMTLNVP